MTTMTESSMFYATQMVFGTAAMAIGGHLMKKAYKWARHNPRAIGRGLNTVSKMMSAKHQGLGRFMTGAARVAQALSNKDSFVNKMATATLKDESPTPSTK